MSTPTSSSFFAKAIPSASFKPPLPLKLPSLFKVIIGSLYSIVKSGAASLIALTTSKA